ncbi:MAG TPA: hypothetical protein VGY58_06730, partial [Gemmataceae bacterium]|nr:hypothetical protein [Gemmataceae bacterium]
VMNVPEGEINVEFPDPRLAEQSFTSRLETSFFTRPFTHPTFILNPDRLAVLEWEQTEYAQVPQPPKEQPRYYIGDGLYTFSGIDYPLQDFPHTITLEKGRTTTKTRVGPVPIPNSEQRLQVISRLRDAQQTTDYARRWLRFTPGDLVALGWYMTDAKDDDALAFLRERLGDRPLLVDWHRLYQSKMERAHPQQDLRPEYRKLVAETKEAPDALYLLGRIEDLDKGDELFRKAATANPPSAYAIYAVGYRCLNQGQFQEAVSWMQKADALSPENMLIHHYYDEALFAAGQYDRLLDRLKGQPQGLGDNLSLLAQRLRVYAAKGDKDSIRSTLAQVDQFLTSPEAKAVQPVVHAQMDIIVRLSARDEAGYLKDLAAIPDAPVFHATLLRGKVEDAATKIADADSDEAIVEHGLVHLAALKARKQKLADDELRKLVRALGKGDREQRQLAGMLAQSQKLDTNLLRRTPIDPRIKRVVLAVAAKLTSPENGKELASLARKLDFFRDATSLCLWKILEK